MLLFHLTFAAEFGVFGLEDSKKWKYGLRKNYPVIAKMSLSIFVPAYNEEKILEKNINKIHDCLKENVSVFELIIVDDSSKDRTSLIAKAMEKKNPVIKHMRFENGPSRRENLAAAMKKAKYDTVGYMDLDLATPLHFLPKLIDEIKGGADIAMGSRRVRGAKVKRSLYRNSWSFFYHKTINLLFNSKVNDYQCGLKLFKKDVLMNLLEQLGYDKNFQRGWFWDAELLLAAEKANYKIKEIPVEWTEGAKSSFKLTRELKLIPYLIRLKMRGFKGTNSNKSARD